MKTGVEQLTLDERLKYLRIMRARYQQADRQTKTALLDQMVAVTGLHRKSVLRQLGGDLQRHPRSTERSATYGPEVQAALAVIAESLDDVCAERRHPQVVTTAEYLAAHGELLLTPTLRAQLAHISLSTVRRHCPPGHDDVPPGSRFGSIIILENTSTSVTLSFDLTQRFQQCD